MCVMPTESSGRGCGGGGGGGWTVETLQQIADFAVLTCWKSSMAGNAEEKEEEEEALVA